ncbi:hypothetical protein ABW19_dt0200163 [Dactylella cylindrospora]|nr:hypothetical protein ABW19_dt0200163 [Dactylella cylindrospora]
MAISLWRRGVQEDLAAIPQTLSSWDNCMEKNYCKYPVIAACVVGGLVLISTLWCCYRCCCRGRNKSKRQTTFFNDPVPSYANGPGPGAQGFNAPPPPINIINTTGPAPQAPQAPQYAYFETGTTSAKNQDDLPVMPSWNGAKTEKVENPDAKVEAIELDEVDNAKHQNQQNHHGHSHSGSSSPAPNSNHMPLGADPSQYHNQPNQNRQNFPPSRMNTPFGPGGGPPRLNTPFGPNGLPARVLTPPTRTQSPYPEGNNMPTANIPAGPTGLPYGATSHDDYDYNPHINAQNQGPYANADIYPPEPTYQQNVSPQFTGTTSGTPAPPAPYQQNSYTGTTVAAEPYPPQPTNPTGGFMAQMDDDYGHSPQQSHAVYDQGHNMHSNGRQNHGYDHNDYDHGGNMHNNGPNNNRQNVGFDHNEFDHGGYNAYSPNQGNQGGYNQQEPYQRSPSRPNVQHNNSGYDRPPQQGWSAF